MKDRIVESLITALLLAILGAAWQMYVEVRDLRHDVNDLSADLKELRGDSDKLWSEVSDQVQKLDKEPQGRQ